MFKWLMDSIDRDAAVAEQQRADRLLVKEVARAQLRVELAKLLKQEAKLKADEGDK